MPATADDLSVPHHLIQALAVSLTALHKRYRQPFKILVFRYDFRSAVSARISPHRPASAKWSTPAPAQWSVQAGNAFDRQAYSLILQTQQFDAPEKNPTRTANVVNG